MHTIKKIKPETIGTFNSTIKLTSSEGVMLEVGYNNENGILYRNPIYPSRESKTIYTSEFDPCTKLFLLRLKNITNIDDFKEKHYQRDFLFGKINLLLEKFPNLTLDFTYSPEAYELLLWIKKTLLEDRKEIKIVSDINDIDKFDIEPDFIRASHEKLDSIIDLTKQGHNVLMNWGVGYHHPDNWLMRYTIEKSDDSHLYAITKDPRKVRQLCRYVNRSCDGR